MIVGEQGPAVVISAETAYWLERICNVTSLRQRLRDGRHRQVSIELLELRRVAMGFDPASLAQGASDFSQAGPESSQGLLSVAEVADLLAMSTAGVTLACREGRLDGQQVGPRRRWAITREAFEEFRSKRAGLRRTQ